MKHYPHHISDFNNATRHLSRIERSIYRDLLDLYYESECALPLSLDYICRRIVANECSTDVQRVLNEFFNETESGWYHVRCEEEIDKYKANNSQRALAGKASAAAKALKLQQALNKRSTSVEQALNGASTKKQNQSTNQPINLEPFNSVSNDTDGKPSKLTDPNEIIFGYGVPMLVNAGTVERQARSFLGGLRKHHGDDALIDKLRECVKAKPLQPLEWLAAALPPKGAPPKLNKQEALEASNAAVAERFLRNNGYATE